MFLTSQSKLLERMRFFNGQRLYASDLEGIEEFHRQMRWLHNQSLHQPGVGSGFAITGKKGSREVTIQPGYAIDAMGREIVLTETVVEQVPPVAGDRNGNPVYYDLTVSYPAEEDLKTSETRDGVCLPRGVIRLREAPAFCWIELGPPPDRAPVNEVLRRQLQQGARIRLGRAQVLNCQLERPVSVAERRNARPSQQPYVACGATAANGWEVNAVAGFGIELMRCVDTSQARFRTTPCYCAHVMGERTFSFRGAATDPVTAILDGMLTVSKPEPEQFLASVLIPEVLIPRNMQINSLVTALRDMLNTQPGRQRPQHEWWIEWMGVEG